jgi:hypothetical protein
VTELHFSGNDKPIYVGDANVVILVGANNCGKTKAIGEINTLITKSDYPNVSFV